MILTRQQREQYQKDGYIVIDPGVSLDVLNGIVADLQDKYKSTEPLDVPYRDARRIQDAWRISRNVKTLALAPKVLAILEELYARKPLPFQTLNFRVGTEQKPHSDTIHFNAMPAGLMCGVWVALENIDMDNGPLVYYPGSQALPEIIPEDLGEKPQPRAGLPRWLEQLKLMPPPRVILPEKTSDVYALYERHIADLIQKRQLKPHYGTLQKGQALIWAANLLHGGSFQKDKSRTRYSQVTHFFFEGCRYYTPLLSRGENIHWRSPERIV